MKKSDAKAPTDPELRRLSLMNLREVMAVTNSSRSTVYDRVARKLFPAPYLAGTRSKCWRRGEVEDWLTGLTH